MARRPDTGMMAAKLAANVPPEALDDMLALRFFEIVAGPLQIPILRANLTSPAYQWMLGHKVVKLETVAGWSRRKWGRPILTELGELVLLSAATDALRQVGRLPPKEQEECDG